MPNATHTPPATLRLRGHEPVPASVAVERRTRQTRLVRALLALGGFLLLAPVVALIPPHIPWALLATGAGVYFAYRQWTGEYIVHSFEGACPRCGNPLAIEPGEKIRLPLQIDCYACHHQPLLEVDSAA